MKRLQHRDRLVIERGKKVQKSLRQISKETNIPKSTIHIPKSIIQNQTIS